MTIKIKHQTVFVADTILSVMNKVQPVTTTQCSSKVFRNSHEVAQHKMELYDAIHGFNNDEHKSMYDDKITSLLDNNKETREFAIQKTILEPVISYREVKISDLTAEQKVEYEKLYNMKIVEETFEDKVVKFKTASKVYAIENDIDVEASIDSLVDSEMNTETVQ